MLSRKLAREQKFQKNRNFFEGDSNNNIQDNHEKLEYENLLSLEFSLNDFETLMENLNKNDPKLQLNGLIGIRRLLALEEYSPFQKFIDRNGIKLLLKFMDNTTNPFIKLESIWAMANLSSSINPQKIIDYGGLIILKKILETETDLIFEQVN